MTAAGTAGLEIAGVTAGYGGVPVLRGVDLALPAGELLCVLGPSGCGKTTLLRVIAGFHAVTAGQVRIGDTVVDDGRTRIPAERRRIGYVPQDGALFPHLTVAANVAFSLHGPRRLDRRDRDLRIAELLELVGLAGMQARHPHQLSGGQQQRVALARALAGRPHMVLLDEPFVALDAGLRVRLRSDVRAILHEASVTAVLVTHDQDEAMSLGDRVAVMRDGRIVQVGEPDDIYRHPVDVTLAGFLTDVTVLPATVGGGELQTALGRLPLDPVAVLRSGDALAVVRPEQFRVAPGFPTGPCEYSGRAVRVDYFGHDALVRVAVAGVAGPVEVVARVVGSEAPAEGAQVAVSVCGPLWALPRTPTAADAG